jgi:hypothetical protein
MVCPSVMHGIALPASPACIPTVQACLYRLWYMCVLPMCVRSNYCSSISLSIPSNSLPFASSYPYSLNLCLASVPAEQLIISRLSKHLPCFRFRLIAHNFPSLSISNLLRSRLIAHPFPASLNLCLASIPPNCSSYPAPLNLCFATVPA